MTRSPLSPRRQQNAAGTALEAADSDSSSSGRVIHLRCRPQQHCAHTLEEGTLQWRLRVVRMRDAPRTMHGLSYARRARALLLLHGSRCCASATSSCWRARRIAAPEAAASAGQVSKAMEAQDAAVTQAAALVEQAEELSSNFSVQLSAEERSSRVAKLNAAALELLTAVDCGAGASCARAESSAHARLQRVLYRRQHGTCR